MNNENMRAIEAAKLRRLPEAKCFPVLIPSVADFAHAYANANANANLVCGCRYLFCNSSH
jgi:hypothetical protein